MGRLAAALDDQPFSLAARPARVSSLPLCVSAATRCVSAWSRDPAVERAPWAGQPSGGCFDGAPGLLLLELHGAQVAHGRVQPLAIVDLPDEVGENRHALSLTECARRTGRKRAAASVRLVASRARSIVDPRHTTYVRYRGIQAPNPLPSLVTRCWPRPAAPDVR